MLTKVNPKVDLVFKKLFGTEDNKDILLSLINAILPLTQQIATIELKNPYNLADYTEGKLTILDIKAEDEKGIQYDIEMQIRGSGFYGKRTLYYWAKIFGSQLDFIPDDNTYVDDKYDGEGGYSELKKCIIISLMDFTFFDDDVCHRCFTLKNRETNQIHKDLDYLDLYFIEMKKFTKELTLAKTVLDRWINFLNNAHRYTNNNLPAQLKEIKEIRKASIKLDAMYLDKKEREHYEGQQKFRLDEISRLKEAVDIAVEKAEKKTEKKMNIEMANKLILKGMENQFIMETTGLSEKQVQKLRSK